ncbi:hypothetical protein FACS189443_3600 [Planctomycetales bacterium]|nr:hypothetical protein FACS189443_3600 [Planctomycetales bacterium]
MLDTAQDSRFAAEFNADVDVEKIATIYASAYLNAVASQNLSVEDAVAEFASLIEVFKTQKQFADVLASAMVSNEEKVALLEKTIAQRVSPLFWNFLQTVAKRNRLDILYAVFVQVQAQWEKQQQRIPVTITTAAEIDEQLFNSLTEKLKSVIGGEPIIKTVIDPETIGGIIVRVGDKIYDASIVTQLEAVRRQMIQHSAQEIQSRRSELASND